MDLHVNASTVRALLGLAVAAGLFGTAAVQMLRGKWRWRWRRRGELGEGLIDWNRTGSWTGVGGDPGPSWNCSEGSFAGGGVSDSGGGSGGGGGDSSD